MDSNWAFLRIAFKNSFVYRSTVFIGIFGSFFGILAQIALWSFIFRGKPGTIQYMTVYVVVAQLLGILYINNISDRIGAKVRSGDFVIDLIKPANPVFTFWSTSVGITTSNMIIRGIPLLLIFLPVIIKLKLDAGELALFVVICGLGFVMVSLMYILIGYLAFIVLEVWPFVRLLNDTVRLLAGAVIPIAFFPPWIGRAVKLMPFHLLYSFPIRLLLEELPPNEIIFNMMIMVFWIIMLSIALKIVYGVAVRFCIVQGG